MATGSGNGPRTLLRLLGDLPGQLRTEVPLSSLTSFRIGGPAWAVFRPRGTAALVEAVARARALGVPWRLLGGGSNVLFPDQGFPGLVILTSALASLSEAEGLLVAEAGVPLSYLANRGFTFLAGIPGTVGGAVAMNAGTRYGTIGDQVAWVEALLPDGRLTTLPPEACSFSYRDSRLRRLGLPILRVGLRPGRFPPLKEVLAERQAAQPLGLPSAGCVFRNPREAPAGWLIDRAGLKGTRVGDAVVSPHHANFICNLGRARATEVLALIERIRHRVAKIFGVWLELELEVVTA